MLEMSPRHPLIESLARHINDSDETSLEETFSLLYETVPISDGESPFDPAGFFGCRLMRALPKLAA